MYARNEVSNDRIRLAYSYLPAAFNRRTGPPSMTSPSLFTRMRSEDFKVGQATPKGFTQNDVGSTGSYNEISLNYIESCVVHTRKVI
jgi:hypothetical protein